MTTKLRGDALDMLLARTVMILRDAGNFEPTDADLYEAMGSACLDLLVKDVADTTSHYLHIVDKPDTAYKFVRGVLKLKQERKS